MSGQCYGCGTEFGFFKKEQGCKNCGFAFCSKCLTKKAVIPKEKLDISLQKSKQCSKSSHPVCNKCYDILTGKAVEDDQKRRPPPEAYLKRMAALEQQEHGASQRSKPKSDRSKYAGLDKPDREIAERLEKLKEEPKVQKIPDKSLHERLARLKGEDPAVRVAPTKPFYSPPDRRTETEQIDDLLEEIANEVEIDSHHPDPATDVENRLTKLRKEQTDKDKDQQNNLDKNNLTSPKNFVKNIDLETGAASGGSGNNGEVDIAKMEALMNEVAGEVEEDAKKALESMKTDKELMARLAQIKQKPKKEGGQAGEKPDESNVDEAHISDESEDDETATKRIMKQFLEEAKLDEKAGDKLPTALASCESHKTRSRQDKSDPKVNKSTEQSKDEQKSKNSRANVAEGDDDYEDPDELPYCCICTEDAVIRCIDCDMDLYCNQCFKDGHKELGLLDHRSIPYKAPKGYR